MEKPTQRAAADEKFVVFRLAGERYGLPIRSVKEIIVLREVTRLPEMAGYMEGIVDLRGRIIPVINLRRKLGLPSGSPERTVRTIVAEFGEAEAGLVVDEVDGVVRVDASSMEAPPQTAQGDGRAVSGITRFQDRLVILLDPAVVLEPQEVLGLSLHNR